MKRFDSIEMVFYDIHYTSQVSFNPVFVSGQIGRFVSRKRWGGTLCFV